MQAFAYSLAQEPPTTFLQSEGKVWLARLFGLTCGFCERDEGPAQARGLALVDTNLGRCEADDLALVQSRLGDEEVELTWKAFGGALHIESHWSFCRRTGIWSRKDRLTNTGTSTLILYRYLARFVFSPGRYQVYSQASHWSAENQGRWQDWPHGSLILGCEGGRTTQGGTPFLGLREVGLGNGVGFHLLPQGNWRMRARAQTAAGDSLPYMVVELGLADENLRLELPAEATLEMPMILLHGLPAGEAHLAAPRFQEYVLENVLTRAKKAAPVVYNTWFDAFDDLDLARLRRQLAAAREVGCEVFTVDAGWYGAGGVNWAGQTGDWREKPDAAFRGRMADFAEEVRAAGLGFGLWVEPERIGPAAPIRQEHPEWFLPGTGGFSYPNLQDERAYAYILGELSRLAETYKLAWMKVDFNFSLGIDSLGGEFYGYYAVWYRLLDEFRARFPDLFLEGCASGGMRLDLNTLSHFDGHFLSDTVDPVDTLRIGEAALLRLPPGRLGRWAVMRSIGRSVPQYGLPLDKAPVSIVTPMGATWERSSVASVDFCVLAAMPGMLGFSGDLAGLPQEARERLRVHVAFFREWREFIAGSVAHLLTPPCPKEERGGWVALQLQKPGERSNLLFVYRLDDAADSKRFYPRNLVPEHAYTLKGLSGLLAPVYRSGAHLMSEGIEFTLPARNSAEILCLG